MIAVTGANGLLGSYIVRKLHDTKTPFVAIKRKGSDIALLSDINSQITWRDADILDSVSILESLEGATGVIHTAAFVSFNPRKAKTVFEINTTGTQNLINACLASDVKRFLHVSSVAALGRQKGQTYINEENKWTESALNSNYAASKYKAELEVFRAQEEGLSTIIINPSVILGFSDWNKSSAKLFKYIWEQNPFYIDGSLNYVDVRDVAEAAFQLFNSSIEGERFVISGGTILYKDFFDKVADGFQKKRPSIKVSTPLAKTMATLETARTWFTGAEPLITRETSRLANAYFEYDNQKVKTALKFNFQSIDTTIQWCCEQYTRWKAIKN
jgi:nucleoside-diphosphate-sugar epimerase